MDTTTLILVIISALLLAIAFFQGRDLPIAGLMVAGRTLWRNLPVLLLGFVIAGLVQLLVPKELISRWLGAQSGVKGVLVACVVGFVSAWSLWSVSRLPIEMALIDPKAALVRYGITFVVPPIAGLIAHAAMRLL